MAKLKFEDTANVGDTIKSYDHQPLPGRDSHWVIGNVIAKGFTPHGFRGYTILVRQTSHLQYPEDCEVYCPFQVGFMEYDGRIIKI